MKSTLITALSLIAASSLSAFGADAKANWDANCVQCHGKTGNADTKMGKTLSVKDLTDAKVQADFTDEQAFKAMKEGLTDKNGKTTMKAIEGLTDDDMKALIPIVRAFKK